MGHNNSLNKKLIEHLSQFVFERRFNLFNEVIKYRTRYVTVVLEDIFQAQNASAVLRTCDCMGVQDVHVIENRNKFNVDSEVDMGASKWLTLKRYNSKENNTLEAINNLRKNGYRIVATTPHTNDCSIKDFDITKGKFALLFGTELTGLSKNALDNADEFVRIPMYGFTESYNISVSVALTLYELTSRLRESEIDYLLSNSERDEIILDWLRATIRNAHLIEKRFVEDFDKHLM
ncbi:MAG: tRNA (guanosine-2-O-)-methyltransferase [Tenuifilum sp.]|uniref:tRNA (guanosine(18)-2'-O)-methyltransferase n=1 Tax=Tenuifilum thalassicum TaxID=2590900 RepID=A0A7D3XEB7_9BACT|nr:MULTISPECIES: RNA methyltransferase [Tenuifilum]MDI3526637.1 tRNA (guanosine-2-O-)-methyltransferase [Tenuifilum sp.]QKG80152.1 RNA methyltransferase [Tenuifilum thalassicum]